MLDCLKPITHKKLIEHELEGFGIRLNKKPPEITFRKKDKGGINYTTTVQNPKLDLDGAPPGGMSSCKGAGRLGASTAQAPCRARSHGLAAAAGARYRPAWHAFWCAACLVPVARIFR